MSYIKATIEQIEQIDSLAMLRLKANELKLQMLVLDLMPSIEVGKSVLLSIKATQVSIAKDISPLISDENQIPAKIDSIKEGKLLSHIDLLCGNLPIESIISTNALSNMRLRVEDRVVALIRASDIYLVEVLDD